MGILRLLAAVWEKVDIMSEAAMFPLATRNGQVLVGEIGALIAEVPGYV
jgi:hypothetical protein